MNVAKPPLAAFRQNDLLAVLDDIGHEHTGLRVEDLGAARHGDDQILAYAPIHLLSAPSHAILGEKLRREIEGDQRIGVPIPLKNDMAPTTAIAAVRATFRYTRLAPETTASIATFAGARMNLDMIYKRSCLH